MAADDGPRVKVNVIDADPAGEAPDTLLCIETAMWGAAVAVLVMVLGRVIARRLGIVRQQPAAGAPTLAALPAVARRPAAAAAAGGGAAPGARGTITRRRRVAVAALCLSRHRRLRGEWAGAAAAEALRDAWASVLAWMPPAPVAAAAAWRRRLRRRAVPWRLRVRGPPGGASPLHGAYLLERRGEGHLPSWRLDAPAREAAAQRWRRREAAAGRGATQCDADHGRVLWCAARREWHIVGADGGGAAAAAATAAGPAWRAPAVVARARGALAAWADAGWWCCGASPPLPDEVRQWHLQQEPQRRSSRWRQRPDGEAVDLSVVGDVL